MAAAMTNGGGLDDPRHDDAERSDEEEWRR
jgi:hypothetical protein